MNSQLNYLAEFSSPSYHNESLSVLSLLHQLQLKAEPRLEEDVVSNDVASSDTLTFAQTPSVAGDSLLDVCTPPLSPYSQASHPLSFSNRLNMGEVESSCPCSAHKEEPIPICYDFVQGRCVRTNCKYLHDFQKLERPNRPREKRGICFDYLRGDCHRGALCRFTHDVSSFAKDFAINVEDDISLAKVKRWGQGICFDFVRGACCRGAKCPWSHNLLEIAVATKKGIENMETSERNKIAETVRRRLHSSLENNNSPYEDVLIDLGPKSVSSIISKPQRQEWVALWNYPDSVFGPLDEFGRPLHWLTNTNTDFMNLSS